jgi:hypothetical protein
MAQLTHDQYETLERAVALRTRVSLRRSGQGRREYIVIPYALRTRDGREAIEARNPTTGHELVIFVDELDSVSVVR